MYVFYLICIEILSSNLTIEMNWTELTAPHIHLHFTTLWELQLWYFWDFANAKPHFHFLKTLFHRHISLFFKIFPNIVSHCSHIIAWVIRVTCSHQRFIDLHESDLCDSSWTSEHVCLHKIYRHFNQEFLLPPCNFNWTVILVKQIEFEQFWMHSNNFEKLWKKTVFLKLRTHPWGTMSFQNLPKCMKSFFQEIKQNKIACYSIHMYSCDLD